jgi:APA family basic amino acid/polyamine antiporter
VFVFAAVPGAIAFLSRGFSIYLGQFIVLTPLHANLASAALIIVLSGVNYIGVRQGAWTQRIFGSLKIAGLILLIGAAIFSSPAAPSPVQPHPFTYPGIGIAVAACLMAYNGWSSVSFVAGGRWWTRNGICCVRWSSEWQRWLRSTSLPTLPTCGL